MIEQEIYDLLKNDSEVVDFVDNRIYAVSLPEQTAYPSISFQTISDRAITTMHNDLPNLNFKRIQVNIHSRTYGNCKVLEERIKKIVYDGNSNGDKVSGRVESVGDRSDPELELFGTRLDLLVSNQ